MNKKPLTFYVLLLSNVLFIIGMMFIFSAPSKGIKAGDKAITRNGGSIDTSVYQHFIDSTTTSYHIGGAICSSIGAVGILGSAYFYCKQY